MDHVGPPRFVSAGETVELAPWNPDPDASYAWTVEHTPADATVALGDHPVEHVAPDASGRYVFALSGPDGVHRQTVVCLETPDLERFAPDDAPRSGGVVGAPAEDAYADAGSGRDGRGRPRVRLDGRVTGDAVVLAADPEPNPASGEAAADLDVVYAFDDRDALSRADVTVEGRTVRIPVDRLPERARVHAVAVGAAGRSVADAVEIRRADGEVSVTRLYEPPTWGVESVYYEAYVRTFAPDAEHGDVFDAIIDRLDHLEALGADVLWLTPVLQSDEAPHGYNITDFFALAPDLGTVEEYERLIDAAHDRGLRVLFDLVLNHSARQHPHFRDAYRNPESDYFDWYDWQPSGEPETYFDWELIANFDYGSLEVRRHLLDAVDRWASLVDGFRCDMAWAVPDGFWREVRAHAKARGSEFLLLDETIPYVPDFHEGLFDVHFDSTTYAALRAVGRGDAHADAVIDAVESRAEAGFPDAAGFLLYAENHDETRYRVECGRPESLAAAGVLCTLPGAPLVYAGQELGQLGQRDAVVWDATDDYLLDHYRRLLAMRREVPALASTASLERLDHAVEAGEEDRVVVYGRVASDADDTGDASADTPRDAPAVVVACNFAEGDARVSVDPALVASPVDLVTGDSVAGATFDVGDVVVLPADPAAFGVRGSPGRNL